MTWCRRGLQYTSRCGNWQALRRLVADLGVTFGSRRHLRVQRTRLGVLEGVPLVLFAHESSVSKSLWRYGEWESHQTELLQLFLRPGDVVVDVGAHIGSHAVALAHVVRATRIQLEVSTRTWKVALKHNQ